ncbi:MAG: 50S ribosomal protein L3 [bacterium]|nr:50S ribosomal protein L3 [bacterium]
MDSKKYPEGLVGRKLGMTQVFNSDGECIPVTIVETGPCFVLDVKTDDRNGYSGVQFGFGPRKMQRVTKSDAGQFSKAGSGAFYKVEEIRCDVNTLGWTAGKEVKVTEVFSPGQMVDVTGVSIGRGFSGVVRRHHIKGQPQTRGTHEVRRHVGSIGCRKFPGKVHKGKRMPGLMGCEQVTVQNLEIVAVRPEENVLLVKGAVPGFKGGFVVVRKAIKTYSGVSVPQPQEAAAAA